MFGSPAFADDPNRMKPYTAQNTKVFWFFFSKKNGFLPSLDCLVMISFAG
jgi:hypothetical protein